MEKISLTEDSESVELNLIQQNQENLDHLIIQRPSRNSNNGKKKSKRSPK